MAKKKKQENKVSLDERIEALNKQMEEARTIIFKCMGAIEILTAIKEEDDKK